MGKATFRTERFNLIALKDIGDHEEQKTVTNDIEGVVTALKATGILIENHPYQRILYCDSEGYWDKVVINEQCEFVAFESIASRDEDRKPDHDADPRVLFAAMLLHEVHQGTGDA
jgi:hypothetical protein